MTATIAARDLALVAAQAAADKGASDILILDVSERLALTDCFLIATGASDRQVNAIVDAIGDKLAAGGVKALRREGERDGRWVLLDFGDVVAHIQHAEERVFYALDRLWGDCPVIPFVDSALPTTEGAGGAVAARDAARPDGGVLADDRTLADGGVLADDGAAPGDEE